MQIKKLKNNKGFTLLIAIITTGILLLVSFVVANLALKEVLITQTSQQSQFAFYNADSGVECAMFWDLKNGAKSAFDQSTAGSITCNGQTFTTGNPVGSIIGGAAISNFTVNFSNACAVVKVTKSGVNTIIDSKGYNTCAAGALRKFERGITITY